MSLYLLQLDLNNDYYFSYGKALNEEVWLNMFWLLLFLQPSSEELHGIVCDVSFQLLLGRFGLSVLTRR